MKLIFALALQVNMALAFSQAIIQSPKLSIFNNGHVFIRHDISFEKTDSMYVLSIPDAATSGTYWLLSKNKENDIKQLKFQYTSLPLQNENENIISALYQCKKNEVKIKTNKQSYFGKIESINFQDSTLAFKQKGSIDSNKTIALENINHLEELGTEKNNVYEFHVPKIERKANVIPSFINKKMEVKEYYVRSNMNWYASTFFKIINKQQADFSLRITIENNLQNFKNADVNLLLNTPNIDNIDEVDPLVKDKIVINNNNHFATQALRGNTNKKMAMMSSRMVQADAIVENYEGEIEQIESTANTQAFSFKNISINKDSKNSFVYFNKTIDYKNYYVAKVPLNYFSIYKVGNCNEADATAYFYVGLKNYTGSYIPENSILFLDENEDVIAKKTFKPLAPLAEIEFQLTPATDIKIHNKEELIQMIFIKSLANNQRMYKHIVRGKIFIESFKKGNNDFQITKALDPSSKINTNETQAESFRIRHVPTENNYGKSIQWNFSLDANTKKTLEYEYEREQVQYE